MDERQRNVFERLASLIPGYDGFADKERRRTADQALRRHLASRIDGLKRRLDDTTRELARSGVLDGLDRLDRLKQRLGTCADTLRHAPHGEGGWSDDWIVTAEDLNRVHEHDEGLHATVDAVADAIAAIHAKSVAGTDAKGVAGTDAKSVTAIDAKTVAEALGPARAKVDELREAIERRDVLLSEVSRCRS
jgi:hypothetical protein